ncbi:hypothetical protein ABIE66_004843 [Peribacillus sp. B2I2]|uniref:hypothetical protein n=1 Tax=Peribacillus sp. B2I2 TaxID=3156468 RepID=UPI0035184802
MGVFIEKMLGVFFEKRKQGKKDVLLMVCLFGLSILNIVEYFSDMDLFWLSTIVLIAFIVLGVLIHMEGKRNRESDE